MMLTAQRHQNITQNSSTPNSGVETRRKSFNKPTTSKKRQGISQNISQIVKDIDPKTNHNTTSQTYLDCKIVITQNINYLSHNYMYINPKEIKKVVNT